MYICETKITLKEMKATILILTNIFMMSMMMETHAYEKKNVLSKLDEVTVFYRGAELKHSASVTLTAGENEVWVEGLSANIDASSLKVGANGGVIISAYEFVSKHNSGKSADPLIQKMSDSLVFYRKKLKEVEIETKVNTQMLELLEKGMTQKFSTSDKNLSLDELSKSMDYFKTKNIEIKKLLIKNGEEKEQYEKAIARIDKQLNESGRNAGALKLSITAPKTVNSRLTVNYCTYAAGWSPYYSINVESTELPIRIISKAKIRQMTGMDWKRVKLTLSTGTPNNGRTAPLFETWFLKEWQAILHNSNAMKNVYKRSMEIDEELSAPAAEEIALDDYLTIDNNALVTTYAIDLPYTIPGNGKEQHIDLHTQQARANYYFYAAPKLSNETFLLAELTDSEKLDLPAGKAQINYEGMYLGETFIDGSSTLKNLTLTLGTDKRISVKREKMQDFSSTKLFGSDIKQVFTYKITVKNNQKKEVKLTLKDQYPISTQKSIEVELLSKETTPPTTNKTDIGVVTWEDTFRPGETKTYQFSYSVKYPKDMHLNL